MRRLGDSNTDSIQNLPLTPLWNIESQSGLVPGILETPQQLAAQLATWHQQFSGGFLQQNQTIIVLVAAALAGLALLKGMRG